MSQELLSFSSCSFKQFEQESELDPGLSQVGMWEGACTGLEHCEVEQETTM